MQIIVNDFESHSRDYISYTNVLKKSKVSRIMFDIFLQQAIAQELIITDSSVSGNTLLHLTNSGKIYAIAHGLLSEPCDY